MVQHRTLLILTYLQVTLHFCYANTANCYWAGSAPNCESSCQSNEYVAGVSSKDNGIDCTIGNRKYCCLKRSEGNLSPLLNRRPMPAIRVGTVATTTPVSIDITTPTTTSTSSTSPVTKVADLSSTGNCRWVGEGPNCTSTCRPGERVAAMSSQGEGNKQCVIGSRKYCCLIVRYRKFTAKPNVSEQATTTQKPVLVELEDKTTVATTALPTPFEPANANFTQLLNQTMLDTTTTAVPLLASNNLSTSIPLKDISATISNQASNSAEISAENSAEISAENSAETENSVNEVITSSTTLSPMPTTSTTITKPHKAVLVEMEDKAAEVATALPTPVTPVDANLTQPLNQTMLVTTTAIPILVSNNLLTSIPLKEINSTFSNHTNISAEITTENSANEAVTSSTTLSPMPAASTITQTTLENVIKDDFATVTAVTAPATLKPSTVPPTPKNRTSLPPLPLIPIIFRNFRALNSSSVTIAQ